MIINPLITLSLSYLTNNISKQRLILRIYNPLTIIKEGNKEMLLEGKAKIYTKYIQKNYKDQMVQNQVFYNPVQVFNRDFTILVMQTYINMLKQQKKQKFEEVNIVDALSASGLRTIRFLKQLTGVKVVYANDISPASHKLMKDNFQLNQLDPNSYKMTLEDANLLLINAKKQVIFDIVDLDPYGSVVPFLDASVQNIKDGGLMCITCTDLKVLAGPDLSKCFYFYGSTRAKVQHFNQNALRILLSTVSSAASRHCKFIQPLISLQTDFYVRVFLRVRKGKKQCSQSALKIGNVYNCNMCSNYEYTPFFQKKKGNDNHFVPNHKFASSVNCNVCQEPYHINGPVWLSQINDISFVQRMIDFMTKQDFPLQLKTKKKIYGNLMTMIDQGQLGSYPLGFSFDKLCKNLKSTTPNRKVLFAGIQSLGKGYKVAPSYISPGFYKTNAPIKVIYDLIKSWKKKDMGQDKYLSNIKQQYGARILKKQIEYKPDFSYQSDTKISHAPLFISMGKNMGPKGKPLKKVLGQEEQNAQKMQLQVQKQVKVNKKQRQQKAAKHQAQNRRNNPKRQKSSQTGNK